MDGSRDPLFGEEFSDALDSTSAGSRARSVDPQVAAGIAIERAMTAAAREEAAAAQHAALGDTARMPTVRPGRTTEAGRSPVARRRPAPDAAPAEGTGSERPKAWPSVATGGQKPTEKVPVRRRVQQRAVKEVRKRTVDRFVPVIGPPPIVWWGLAALAILIVLIALLTRPMSPGTRSTSATTASGSAATAASSGSVSPSAPASGSASASASASATPSPVASTGVRLDIRVEDASGSSRQSLVVSTGTTTLVAGPTRLPYHAGVDAGPGQTVSVLVPQPTPGAQLSCVITASGAVTGSMTRQGGDGMLDCTTRVADIAAGGT